MDFYFHTQHDFIFINSLPSPCCPTIVKMDPKLTNGKT